MNHSKNKELTTAVDQKLNHEVVPTKPATAAPVVQGEIGISEADIVALAAEARELNDDTRVGDDLKFTKGKWAQIVGEEKIEISATVVFAADVLSYWRGWIKWEDRKPTFKIIGRPIDGFVSPMRKRLGDLDENRWPRNSRGEPQDPWQENFSLTMRNLTSGRICTWNTTSWYGQKAMGALLTTFTRDCHKHRGCMPVVLLSSEEKTTTNYGDVAAPVLTVVDWQPFGEGTASPGMRVPPPPLPPVQELLPPSKETKMLGEAMDDEIPY
jgi:hypothetical protein